MGEIVKVKAAPSPTLRRLPRYLHLLNHLKSEGITDISSTMIAKELKIDSTQVRKDIEFTEITGRPKTGFKIGELIEAIREFLNWNNANDAFLVGAGNLGSSMLGYTRFKDYGLNFVAAFDDDERKVGSTIHDTPILPLNKLVNLGKRMKVNIGVITVPAYAAQHVAELMVEAGIKAIWNFAPIHLNVPDDIIVENAQLTQSLAVISRRLTEALTNESPE